MRCRLPAAVALLCSTALFCPPVAFAQPVPAANVTPPPSAPALNAPVPNQSGIDKSRSEDKAKIALKAFFDARLAGLHSGLELTPEQMPLWAPVEAAIRDLAKAHAAAHREGGDDGEPADALHQLTRISERLIRGGQAMKALADATGPLLATLSDDQKERLPKLLDGMQPKEILAKAFNLPDDRGAAHGERDADDGGYRGREYPRHRDDAYGYRSPRHGRDDDGRDGSDQGFHDRDFGDRAFGNRDSGSRFERNHERHDREADRHHDGYGDRHELDRDQDRPEGYHHRPDSDDERT